MSFVADWYVDTGYSAVLGTGTYRRYAVDEAGGVYCMHVDPLHGSYWKKA